MKKHNQLEIRWMEIHLRKLGPSFTWSAVNFANELFGITPPCRSQFSDEDHQDFVGHFSLVLSKWVEKTDKKIDYGPLFEKFRTTFKL